MKFETVKSIVYLTAAVVLIVIVARTVKQFKAGIGGIFSGVGLIDSEQEKADKDAIKRAVSNYSNYPQTSPWGIHLWQSPGSVLVTQAKTNEMVGQLWDSVGYIYDSPEKLSAVIRQLNYKSQVSWLAYNFNKRYGLDLLTWLADKYDTESQVRYLAEVIVYVNKLK